MNKSLKLAAITIGLVALSTVAGVLTWQVLIATKDSTRSHLTGQPDEATTDSLMLLPQPRVIADFRLTDKEGQPFSLEGWKNSWSLLFFGFTACPDICPNTLFQLKQVRQGLEQAGKLDAAPGVFLVSVDPERDTPAKLKEYLDYFDPTFRGLTGDPAQLKALTYQLGVMYRIEEHAPQDTEYTVDHSASILLINPQGKLHGVFPAPHDVGAITNELLSMLAGT